MEHTHADSQTDLRDYLLILRRRKWSIGLVAGLVLLSALFFSFRQTAVYSSEARVVLLPTGTSPIVQPDLDTERGIADSAAVAAIVMQNLHLSGSPQHLLHPLTVSVETNTNILDVHYADPRPATSQRMAQGFADAYLQYKRRQALDQVQGQATAIQQQIDSTTSRLAAIEHQLTNTKNSARQSSLTAQRDTMIARLSALQTQLESVQVSGNSQTRIGDIVQPATLPTAPSSPDHVRDALLGIIVGLALGTGWAFVRERLDDRIRSQQELERRLNVPVLAAVPNVTNWRDQATTMVVTLAAPNSPVSEAYRTLRTNLQFLGTKEELRTLVVTSPTAGDGKTATAINLAVAMAQADKRVVVVSADLRRPRLHRFLDLPNETGLSLILADSVTVGEAAARIEGIRNLRVIPSGPVPPNPAELLQSARMRELLRQLQDSADVVLLDTPPVLAVADASILASLVDGTLVVVNGESASRNATAQARRQLETAGARIVGAVLNNFDPARSEYYAYQYAYYQHDEGAESNGRGLFNGSGNGRKRRDRAVHSAPGLESAEPDP